MKTLLNLCQWNLRVVIVTTVNANCSPGSSNYVLATLTNRKRRGSESSQWVSPFFMERHGGKGTTALQFPNCRF